MSPDRFWAGFVAAWGALVAGLCGLCTLWWGAQTLPAIVQKSDAGYAQVFLLPALLIGAVGMAVGGSLFHAARSMRRKADLFDVVASALTVLVAAIYLLIFAAMAVTIVGAGLTEDRSSGSAAGSVVGWSLMGATFAGASWACAMLARGGWGRFRDARASLFPGQKEAKVDE